MSSEGSSADGIFEAGTAARGAPAPSPATPRAGVRFSEGSFERGRGLRFYHCAFTPDAVDGSRPAALVVLMHGYGEHCRRYDEVAHYLARRGHVVCAMDARGHGRSSGQRGYVRAFDDYLTDLAHFVEQVRLLHPAHRAPAPSGVAPARPLPLILFGHSNGGLIAARAVQAGLVEARGLILTSPLFGLREERKAVPDVVARALSALAPRLPAPNGIRSRDLTHDPTLLEAHRHDRWVHGVATSRWYWSMTLATRLALAEADRLRVPLLIAQAELDPIVAPASVSAFHARVGSADKTLIVRQGAFHEVLNETGRHELFAIAGDWIERVSVA